MLTAALIEGRYENSWGNYTTEFGYDSNLQLTSAQNDMPEIPYSLEKFSYDSIGNRTSTNSEYGESTYGQSGQLILNDWKYEYLHDANGNLIQKNEKGTIGVNYVKYDYSSSNQLVGIEVYEDEKLVKEIDYFYGATGKRLEKVVSDVNFPEKSFTRRYTYFGNEVSAELDENNTILAKYTHSGLRTDDVLAVDVLLAGKGKVAQDSRSYFFLKDGSGTVSTVVDSSGAKIQHHVYSVFGKILKIEDGTGNDITSAPLLEPYFSFTGREYDKETGLYYYRARYYSADMGRFLQADNDPGDLYNPITLINKYTYAGNNSVMNVDPDGNFFFTAMIIGGIIGAVSSAIAGENPLEGALIGAVAGLVGAFTGGAAGLGAGKAVASAIGKGFWSHAAAFVGGAVVGAMAGGLAGGFAGGVVNLVRDGNFDNFWEGFDRGLKVGIVAGGLTGAGFGLATYVRGDFLFGGGKMILKAQRTIYNKVLNITTEFIRDIKGFGKAIRRPHLLPRSDPGPY